MTELNAPVPTHQTKIVRSGRTRTARLQVQAGIVSVYVPKTFSDEDVDQLLIQYRVWIHDQLQIHNVSPPHPQILQNGEAFPYLGKNYRLKIGCASSASVHLVQGRLQICAPVLDQLTLRALIRQWYHQQATIRVNAKVTRFASILGVTPAAIKIRGGGSGWSAITAQGTLQFHWKIVMAPHSVINYVVAQALCHLKYPLRGEEFWRTVDSISADTQACRDWLNIDSPAAILARISEV